MAVLTLYTMATQSGNKQISLMPSKETLSGECVSSRECFYQIPCVTLGNRSCRLYISNNNAIVRFCYDSIQNRQERFYISNHNAVVRFTQLYASSHANSLRSHTCTRDKVYRRWGGGVSILFRVSKNLEKNATHIVMCLQWVEIFNHIIVCYPPRNG